MRTVKERWSEGWRMERARARDESREAEGGWRKVTIEGTLGWYQGQGRNLAECPAASRDGSSGDRMILVSESRIIRC